MSKTEQKQIRNYFGRRLDEEGRGFPNRPDDEAPVVVARRAYLQGTWIVYLVRAGIFIIAGPLLFSFFTAGEHDALTIGGLAACVAGCAFFMAQWGVRVRRINRYFATIHGEAGMAVAPAATSGEPRAGVALGAARGDDRPPKISAVERGRLIGGVSAILIIWILWLVFGFTAGIPITTTAVLLLTMASAQVLSRSRSGTRKRNQ
jgi:uncharacterized membrane protein HdeD (DUF308 family)